VEYLVELVSNVGFPIGVAVYLMTVMRSDIRALREAVTALTVELSHHRLG
jgi:hypothetical protein